MAQTTYIAGTVIQPAWLNDVDALTYGTKAAATTVLNVTAIRLLSKLVITRASTLGYYSNGDGGDGTYYYDSTDTSSSDNGGTIIVAADGGRWKLTQAYPISAKQFGAKGDNATDDSTALQTWLTYLGSANSKVGRLSGSTYFHATALTCPNAVTLIGDGYLCTQLRYTGVSDQFVITNPINSSTLANISLRGIYFNAPNLNAQRGCLFDTGSSNVTVSECFFNAGTVNSLGVILNQSELWTFRDCYFAGAGHGPWLINGTDRSGTANSYFTNRIKFDSCQFNVTGFEVIDDGGIDHTFDTCNFNAGTTWMRVAGVNGFNVRGGEFENCSAVGITFVATRWQGAASITSAAASISGASFSQPLSTALVNIDSTALRTINATANTFNNPGVVFQGMDNCTSVHAADNFQGSTGDALSKINNVYTAQPATVVWDTGGTAITPGASVISAVKSRCGRDEVLTVTVTLGAGWVGGTGNWRFTSDDVSAGLGNIGTAFFQCAGSFYTGIVFMDSPAGKMTCFASNTTGAAVSATVPAAWVANTSNILKFTVSYVCTHQIN